MTLDMTQKNNDFGIVSYQINDVDYGVCFKLNIEKKYCMAVSMYYKEDIQLLKD